MDIERRNFLHECKCQAEVKPIREIFIVTHLDEVGKSDFIDLTKEPGKLEPHKVNFKLK